MLHQFELGTYEKNKPILKLFWLFAGVLQVKVWVNEAGHFHAWRFSHVDAVNAEAGGSFQDKFGVNEGNLLLCCHSIAAEDVVASDK